MPINKDRIIKEFKILSEFDSETYHEKDISEYLIKRLADLGLEVKYFDVSNELKKYTTSTDLGKNIYATLKGNSDGDVLFLAHQDTVSPGVFKKVIFDGDLIKSDGTTVLGADDISGLVSIIEALEVIKEDNILHKSIEVFFPIAEETYCKGSRVFDYNNIKSKVAYVFDLAGSIGTAAIEAPLISSFNIKVFGKSAHSGFNPELGVDAIKIASNAISKITSGRISKNTTLNFGVISGGSQSNIVPDLVEIKGELRSLDEEEAFKILDDVENTFKTEGNLLNGNIEFVKETEFHSYKINSDEEVIKNYVRACTNLGIDYKFISTFGGSDNNNLTSNGIRGIVVASGYNNPHTKNETSSISDLMKSSALAVELARGDINENN